MTRALGLRTTVALTRIPFDYYSTNTALPSMTKSVLHAHVIASTATGGTGRDRCVPDKETAKIDDLVEEQRRLIDLLKEKRQAVISQAVTKGLNPNVPMKDSGVEWLGKRAGALDAAPPLSPPPSPARSTCAAWCRNQRP
jgi:type I restriction enzyme S subunit